MKNLIFLTSIGLMAACGDTEPTETTKVETKSEVKKTPEKVVAKKAPAPKAVKAAPAADTDSATVTVSADGVAELTIEASDAMQYNAKKLTVEAGQKVKLTLTHTGNMPKAAMGHNLVILNSGIEAGAFAALAATAFEEEYFPAASADQTVAHTKLIGGGESTSIEFVAPAAGSYTFICTYPGHWGAMRGEMVVTAAK